MADEEATDDAAEHEGASPWLFLVGLLVFLGSAVLFVADLVRGVDVFRSIAANAAGAVLLILWAALDTLSDPDSEVATWEGATGTALLLYGVYLLLSGVTIATTGLLFHDRVALGLLYLGLAVATIFVGFLVFPTGSVVGDATDGTDGADGTTEQSGDPETDA